MSTFVFFDLDNTLVDSLHLKPLRNQRRWADVYRRIQTVAVFDGIPEVWRQLRTRSVHLGIVTHSPGTYARRMLAHAGLEPDALVAYHDLNGKRKPSAYGYELGSAGRLSRRGIAIGDERNDLLAANAFGCIGVFAGWSRNPVLTADDCEREGWIYAAHPEELLALVDALPKRLCLSAANLATPR
jgi:phosphoglycolate phosphatase-like HAD superfamily hydrolase